MNSNDLVQNLQKGFHVTLGATTSLVESLQDGQKRDETIAKIQRGEWAQLTDELAAKGTQTEQEAREFVNNLMQQGQTSGMDSSGPRSTSSAIATPKVPADIQQDLQQLTEQIATIRQELEQERNPDS